MFYVRGVCKTFFRKGAPKFVTFSSVFFPAELILSNLSNKNDSRGSGGMLAQKFFENLHTVMAILALFEQFQAKVVGIFGP